MEFNPYCLVCFTDLLKLEEFKFEQWCFYKFCVDRCLSWKLNWKRSVPLLPFILNILLQHRIRFEHWPASSFCRIYQILDQWKLWGGYEDFPGWKFFICLGIYNHSNGFHQYFFTCSFFGSIITRSNFWKGLKK